MEWMLEKKNVKSVAPEKVTLWGRWFKPKCRYNSQSDRVIFSDSFSPFLKVTAIKKQSFSSLSSFFRKTGFSTCSLLWLKCCKQEPINGTVLMRLQDVDVFVVVDFCLIKTQKFDCDTWRNLDWYLSLMTFEQQEINVIVPMAKMRNGLPNIRSIEALQRRENY